MEKKYSNSNFAIYFIGLSWLVYGVFFPLYRLSHMLICAAISIFAYIIAAKVLPKQVTMVERPALLSLTKDEKLNAAIKEVNESIAEIRKLNDIIPDEKVSTCLEKIEAATKKIFNFINENPKELSSVRRFVNYYLPTTLKLLQTYVKLDEQQAETENIAQTKQKIAEMLETIVTAFDKQLDSLFAYTALDISAEISAMKGILASEGLGEDDGLQKPDEKEDTALKL